MPPFDHASVRSRLAVARDRIAAAGGDPARVTVVAVTKGFGPDAADAARASGLVDLGENYARELAVKAALVARAEGTGTSPTRWHFLGPVQRNKVASIAGLVHLWQAVDRAAAGEEVARRAAGAAVLVQLDLSGDGRRPGCRPSEAPALVERLRDAGLAVRGLMGVAPRGDPGRARAGFRLLTATADALGLPERSMGMTDDLEIAVEEGATVVRLGRALFGPRPDAPKLRR